jgi:tRNA G18 (ribose-2'-O)-methylase SpoU
MHEHVICECSNAVCRLRYPATWGEPASRRCPRCHGPVRTVHRLAHDGEIRLGGPPPLDLHALLDNIRSVHNVGSIFRSADGAGFATLYLCGITPTPDNPKLAKTALGAHEALRWQAAPNALELAHGLRATGYTLWALEAGAQATPLFAAPPLPARLVLVVGSEVTGVDPDLLALCEQRLAIPMRGVKRSLNVATAFGIAALVLGRAAEQAL